MAETDQEKQSFRPFHETVVDAIKKAATRGDLDLLSGLIQATKIPSNHDAIVTAFDSRVRELGWRPEAFPGLHGSLAHQKLISTRILPGSRD